MNSSLSYEEEVNLILSSTSIPIVQLSIGLLGIGITTGAFFYIKIETKINPFFKKMLLAMTIHQNLSYSCLSIGSFVLFFAGYLNSLTCFFTLLNSLGLMSGTYLFSTQISKCRFECAIAISKMKIPDLEAMQRDVIKQTIVHYILSCSCSFLLSMDCSICVCQDKPKATFTLFDLYFAAIVITGIVYDVRMILFLKARNNIQPLNSNQIVPFFSGGNDELNDKIPKNSSLILSCMTVTLCLILMPYYFGVVIDNIFWTSNNGLFALNLLTMPLFICFAVKKKEIKKSGNKSTIKKSSVKTGLKFYDDELGDDPSNMNPNSNDEHCDRNNPTGAATNCEENTGNQDDTIVNKNMTGLGKECELSIDSSTDQNSGLVAPTSTPTQNKSTDQNSGLVAPPSTPTQSKSTKKIPTQDKMPTIEI